MSSFCADEKLLTDLSVVVELLSDQAAGGLRRSEHFIGGVRGDRNTRVARPRQPHLVVARWSVRCIDVPIGANPEKAGLDRERCGCWVRPEGVKLGWGFGS